MKASIPFDMPLDNNAASDEYSEAMRQSLAELDRIREALEAHAASVIVCRANGQPVHYGHCGDIGAALCRLQEVATWTNIDGE